MKTAYPIVLTQGKTHIVVYIPDFDVNTQGADVADAMEMARDAIGIVGIDMQDDGETLPKPSALIKTQKDNPDAVVTLVDVDFVEYRRRNDLRTVKKNCTLPAWLNSEAERAGVNFSAILQNGLKDYLRITSDHPRP
jgi:predicted RNase H-like HicB family nuclease